MLFKPLLGAILSAALIAAQSDSEVVAVFLLGRHGDRTSRIFSMGVEGSSVLTTLGMNQVYETGIFWRNKYFDPSSSDAIPGLNSTYHIPQIYASAPDDNALFPSTIAFFQGIYPPSLTDTFQTLANGTGESSPLNGYQYVSINGLPATSPDVIWVAGDQSCPVYTKASQAYYNSTDFLTRKTQLQPFYDKFRPLLAGIIANSSIGFQSAYNIFDYLNVGYIHNATIFANLSSDDLFQLRTLADEQSFKLVYNISSPNASIGGKALAGNILSRLNQTVSQSNPSLKITYFGGAYDNWLAFWGISNLTAASPNFMGLPDYASVMTFELRRPAGTTGFDNLSVRFGFRNGSDPSAPVNYFPMFGQNVTDLPWSQWSQQMSEIAITSDASWCSICNSTLSFCTGSGSTAASTTSGQSGSPPSSSCSSGLSDTAAGGIGAGVTIGVIAVLEGLVALWYLSNRKKSPTKGGETGSIPSEGGSK